MEMSGAMAVMAVVMMLLMLGGLLAVGWTALRGRWRHRRPAGEPERPRRRPPRRETGEED